MFDAWILPRRVVDPSKKVPDLNCEAQDLLLEVKGKGKVFPYSLPSVGPGADPGVQAVSPQVT